VEVAEVEPQETEALASFQVYCSALFIIDFHLQLGKLLPESLGHGSNQPVTSSRNFDLNGEARTARAKQNNPIISASSGDSNAASHLNEVFGAHGHRLLFLPTALGCRFADRKLVGRMADKHDMAEAVEGWPGLTHVAKRR
jgi:hypothetical protein